MQLLYRLDHKLQIDYCFYTGQDIKYFSEGCFMVQLYGKQNASPVTRQLDTKKELRKKKAGRGLVTCKATTVKVHGI